MRISRKTLQLARTLLVYALGLHLLLICAAVASPALHEWMHADADHADNGADDADAPDTADLGVDSENAAENVDPDAEGADDADDADDSCDHAARRCDHCGTLGATGRWDWTGRPDGIWLHSRCEEPWFDSEKRRQ